MSVRAVNPTTHPTVFAEGGPALQAEFDTYGSDESYSIGATAPCSPGDAFTLHEEDSAERDQGKVLPGDEGLVLQEEPRSNSTKQSQPAPALSAGGPSDSSYLVWSRGYSVTEGGGIPLQRLTS